MDVQDMSCRAIAESERLSVAFKPFADLGWDQTSFNGYIPGGVIKVSETGFRALAGK